MCTVCIFCSIILQVFCYVWSFCSFICFIEFCFNYFLLGMGAVGFYYCLCGSSLSAKYMDNSETVWAFCILRLLLSANFMQSRKQSRSCLNVQKPITGRLLCCRTLVFKMSDICYWISNLKPKLLEIDLNLFQQGDVQTAEGNCCQINAVRSIKPIVKQFTIKVYLVQCLRMFLLHVNRKALYSLGIHIVFVVVFYNTWLFNKYFFTLVLKIGFVWIEPTSTCKYIKYFNINIGIQF